MAGAALLGRLTWRTATARSFTAETASARTIVLEVPGWPGHLPGQHVDVRLTAPDGYTATRAYSIADATNGDLVSITVAEVPGGEVSGYLAGAMEAGDQVEVRGPLGGWFVWRPEDAAPVQLVGGGTGLVPLMAMVRSRARAGAGTPMRLLCSVRDPGSALYSAELALEAARAGGVAVTWQHTRVAPPGRDPGRIDADVLRAATFAPSARPTCFVCGPTPFVEAITALLVDLGHDPARIRAERFGPTGGQA